MHNYLNVLVMLFCNHACELSNFNMYKRSYNFSFNVLTNVLFCTCRLGSMGQLIIVFQWMINYLLSIYHYYHSPYEGYSHVVNVIHRIESA